MTKKILFLIGYTFILTGVLCQQQKTLVLHISNPQPRLNQEFNIYIDIAEIKKEIFKPLDGKITLSEKVWNTGRDQQLTYSVTANKIGTNEIGPLQFDFNGKHYTTGAISYEVVEPLPRLASGIWFRKVKINDSTFYIIVEQHVPEKTITTKLSENSWRTSTEPLTDKVIEFNQFPDLQFYPTQNIIKAQTGSSYSESKSEYDNNGTLIKFRYNWHLGQFTIKKGSGAIITRAYFKNLPEDYQFEDIILQ